MPWQCRMIEPPDDYRANPPKVGDMFFARYLIGGGRAAVSRQFELSAEYLRDWDGNRPPLIVTVPALSRAGYRLIVVDGRYQSASDPNPEARGWTVTGEPPNITVSPSINAIGDYHGFLRDGVLSDDLDGRGYSAQNGRNWS